MRSFVHTDFDRAFRPDEVFESLRRGRIAVRQIEVADLALPSGKIVACDPSCLEFRPDRVPFTRLAPKGLHPVSLCLAKLDCATWSEEWVACAMVRFSPAPAVKWEMAVLPNQNEADLPAGEFLGYGVDAGLGCFIDAKAAEKLTEKEAEVLYFERLLDELQKDGQFRSWAETVVDPDTGANLVAFSTGYGDGAYPSYWGIDSAGESCCLVTDFGILLEDLEGEATFRLGESVGQTLRHPDFDRIGLTVRVLPSLSNRNLRLETEGGDCEVIVTDGGNECFPNRSQFQVSGQMRSQDFWFAEPLRGNFQLTLRYSLGVRAL